MIVGCYDLRLDCDGTDEKVGCLNGPHAHQYRSQSFTGDETGAQARARARKAMWLLKRDGTCVCPACRRGERKWPPRDTPRDAPEQP